MQYQIEFSDGSTSGWMDVKPGFGYSIGFPNARISFREKPEWVPGWYARRTTETGIRAPHLHVYDVRYWDNEPKWGRWTPVTEMDWDN